MRRSAESMHCGPRPERVLAEILGCDRAGQVRVVHRSSQDEPGEVALFPNVSAIGVMTSNSETVILWKLRVNRCCLPFRSFGSNLKVRKEVETLIESVC
jgi:hypothetical protein